VELKDGPNDEDVYGEVSSIGSNNLPPDAESLLREEMMKLSLKDRNDFQEEIHGVQCLAPEETPDFLKSKLEKLEVELNGDAIPIENRKAFLKSQEMFAKKNKPTFVNSEEFRLRFLRCELFDVPTAALRITKYLSLVSELFGDFALQRPIRISDFSKTDLREFRKGRYQLLPYRDRAGVRGRRILGVFPDNDWETMSPVLRTKIWLYLTYVAGEDIEAQKYGIVVLVWFDSAWTRISKKPVLSAQNTKVFTLGVRTSAVHLCTPDTPVYRFRRSILLMRLRREKSRVKIHVGKSTELLYTLQSFGLPTDYIPISFTGKVKEKYIKEWIRLRQLVEDERLAPDWTAESVGTMIECPYLDDCIFRNGTSLLSHPGNIFLRSLIASKSMTEENQKKNTKVFVEEIIAEMKARGHENDGIKKDGRFLIWSDQGWWKQVLPENEKKEIHSKISRIVRDTRKLVIANEKQLEEEKALLAIEPLPKDTPIQFIKRRHSASHSIFLQPEHGMNLKRQKLSEDGDCFGIDMCDLEWFCNHMT